MDKKGLAATLAAAIGFGTAGFVPGIAATPTAGFKTTEHLSSMEVSAKNDSSTTEKVAEASCKGKEATCKGKETSCKGKDSSCKGKSGAAKTCKVGGAEMYPTKDIIDNASNSPIHTTLVAAVKAAGLVDTLKGAGPFTVFAPTNDAFNKLPAGTVDSLLKPENKSELAKILTYHVVPGHVDAAALKEQIKSGGGTAKLKTVQGEELTAKMKGGKVELTDSKGNMAKVTQCDVEQSNGVIHVIDKVMMP